MARTYCQGRLQALPREQRDHERPWSKGKKRPLVNQTKGPCQNATTISNQRHPQWPQERPNCQRIWRFHQNYLHGGGREWAHLHRPDGSFPQEIQSRKSIHHGTVPSQQQRNLPRSDEKSHIWRNELSLSSPPWSTEKCRNQTQVAHPRQQVLRQIQGNNLKERNDLPTRPTCRKPPRYVPYKCTYVPYDGTFGTSDQGQMLDVWQGEDSQIHHLIQQICRFIISSIRKKSNQKRYRRIRISTTILDHTDRN